MQFYIMSCCHYMSAYGGGWSHSFNVGTFLERRAGGFVIADRLLPRIRSYGEDGRLEAAFGRFGDGPFEFRQVSSLAKLRLLTDRDTSGAEGSTPGDIPACMAEGR